MRMCALVSQNKVIRRKRTLRTWGNYNHQKKPELPARHLQDVLLLCQVLLRGKGGVALLPGSPGLSAFPLVCRLSAWFTWLTPSSAPPCLQSFSLNSVLNLLFFYCLSAIIEQSPFIVRIDSLNLILSKYGFKLCC